MRATTTLPMDGPLGDLPESPVPLNSLEIGWLMGATILKRAEEGDPMARRLYVKLKAASIANGVVWYYGDPFPIEPHD